MSDPEPSPENIESTYEGGPGDDSDGGDFTDNTPDAPTEADVFEP